MSNTLIRSLSGALFVAIMAGSLLVSPVIFATVMLFVILVMVKEFLSITLIRGTYKAQSTIVSIASFTIYLLLFLYSRHQVEAKYLWIAALPLIILMVSLLYSKDARSSEKYNRAPFLFMALIYISLPMSLTSLVLFDTQAGYTPGIMLSLLILLWSSDIGAYISGMTFGQKNGHKLFPSISPKKSWEGFFGGMASTLAAAAILKYTGVLDTSLTHALILSLVIFITGALGDLSESLLKRNFTVKDSGSIMPGHGGLLDRFDGALLAFPAAIAYIKLFELI
jgi:phosphatidate cytidylyltransferase